MPIQFTQAELDRIVEGREAATLAVVSQLKIRFPNLTAEETLRLAQLLVRVALTAYLEKV